ncbi:cell wall-binding repeat-containing protein [Bacillus sp. FJAT-44742]|uniref:cell wall-binding repeat-containing protein n=1 Tax=Bacillus sp. FJAT-44742 TaxID=2014005 RepID=UPI0018E206D9|nr:cell wall-binding repeat-containing protein [Bacillus sp. FJAT-44742]
MKKTALRMFGTLSMGSVLIFATACNEGAGSDLENEAEGEETSGEDVEEINGEDESEDINNDQDIDNEEGDDSQEEENGDIESDDNNEEGDRSEFAEEPEEMNEQASENVMTDNTKNVTRLNEEDPVSFSIMASQTLWPATHSENQPGTVILAPEDEWQAALASLHLVHHPNNGPVLLTENGELSDDVLDEIERLNPQGNENGTEVLIVGQESENIEEELNDYEVESINEENHAALAKQVDDHFSEITGEYSETVLIGSMEEDHKELTITAGNWISHMDGPLLYVEEGEIPSETAEAIEGREDVKMYVLGSEDVISDEIVEDLEAAGEVERIEGQDPTELSIAFAQFRDDDNDFGWGADEPGKSVSFVSTETPSIAIAAAPFGHLGKHAPMVWLEEGELNEEVYEYLAELKPLYEENPMEGPYSHAYVMGDTETISFEQQGIIDEKLEIAPENEEDAHGAHGTEAEEHENGDENGTVEEDAESEQGETTENEGSEIDESENENENDEEEDNNEDEIDNEENDE